jgi:hypothetical protein
MGAHRESNSPASVWAKQKQEGTRDAPVYRLSSIAPRPELNRSGNGYGAWWSRIAGRSELTWRPCRLDSLLACRCAGRLAQAWEVRSNLSNNRIARVMFFVAEGRIGVVHGFIKKTQKTPPADLALAQKRMKEMTK